MQKEINSPEILLKLAEDNNDLLQDSLGRALCVGAMDILLPSARKGPRRALELNWQSVLHQRQHHLGELQALSQQLLRHVVNRKQPPVCARIAGLDRTQAKTVLSAREMQSAELLDVQRK